MLQNFKEKFINVQDGITSSLQGIKTGDKIQKENRIDVNAGAALLAKYQLSWETIRIYTEENVRQFQLLDKLIEVQHRQVIKGYNKINSFNKNLSSLKSIITLTEKAVNSIGEIRSLIDEINEKLIDFEDLYENEVHQMRLDEASKKLVEYRHSKLMQMDVLRASLAEEYDEKIKVIEDENNKMKKSKSDEAERKFQQDLKVFKMTGVLPKSELASSSVKLEEVEIEQDFKSLNEYLS